VADTRSSNERLVGVAEQVVRSRGRRDVGQLLRDVSEAIDEHEVLTYATAIAFRILLALLFLGLAGLAFSGVIHQDQIWRRQLGPGLSRIVSPDFYRELDRSVDRVMTARRWWWLSIGLALTLWQVSSGVRALMGALDRIYETEDRRPFWLRFATSVWLAAVICIGLAIGALIVFVLRDPEGSAALRILLALGRWIVLAAILMGIIVALLRFAPSTRLRLRWLTIGSGLAIFAWLLTTWLFGWYLANFAYRAYQATFGVLSLLVVVMTYLYIASLAFLVGAEVDALLVAAQASRRSSRRRVRPSSA
jgi:membrane protein